MISRIAIILLVLIAIPASASAHLATFGSWETTERHLKTLFPSATTFRVKSYEYSDAEVARLEKDLGFHLYPEDRTPAFYIAMNGKKFLGVAMFIDPRLEGDEGLIRLEVGIGVDRKGKVSRVSLFEYRGDPALVDKSFLKQFVGLKHGDDFNLATNDTLHAAKGLDSASQLVANAAREALLLMKVSLGKKKK